MPGKKIRRRKPKVERRVSPVQGGTVEGKKRKSKKQARREERIARHILKKKRRNGIKTLA